MKSYTFPIVIEPDEDRWSAYIPELVSQGGATWGYTKEDALQNIQEVGQMVIEALLEEGKQLPPSVRESDQATISINIWPSTIRSSAR